MEKFKNNNSEILELLFASLIGVLLLLFFTSIFQNDNRVSGANYFGFATLSIFTSLTIYFRRKIREVDVKNMKLILQKTQRVKNEIDQIAFNLAKIIANLSAYSMGSWLNRKNLNDDIQRLLNNLEVDVSEKKKILELPRIVEKSMKKKEPLTKEEQEKFEEMFSLEEKPVKK